MSISVNLNVVMDSLKGGTARMKCIELIEKASNCSRDFILIEFPYKDYSILIPQYENTVTYLCPKKEEGTLKYFEDYNPIEVAFAGNKREIDEFYNHYIQQTYNAYSKEETLIINGVYYENPN